MTRALVTLVVVASCSLARTGRLVDGPCTHFGARGHGELAGAAVTLRLTTDWPAPCARDRWRRSTPVKVVVDTLRTMAGKARDSAALHALHGERREADHWTGLAQLWEDRVAALEETREDRAA